MDYKKVLVAVIIAAVVVTAGIFWSDQTPEVTEKEAGKTEKTQKPADFDSKQWSTQPGASIDLKTKTEESTDKETSYERFTIPGRVVFPKNASPEKVSLHVSILPLKRSKAAEIAQKAPRNPIRYMFKGDAEKNFQADEITRKLTSDKNGKFEIKNAIPGIYSVSSTDTQWSGSTEQQQVELASRVRPLEVTINQTATLIGTVVDPDKTPVKSAEIEYTTKSKQFTTDENGQFRLTSLEPGEKIDFLKILKEGYKPYYLDEKPLEPGEIRHDTYIISKGSILKVEVQTADGESVKNGKLILTRADDKEITSKHHLAAAHGGGKIVSLNEDGEYTFTNLRPGKVNVTMRFSNYIPDVRTVEIPPGQTKETTLTVREGVPLNITYINEKNGEAIRNILPKVKVFDSNGNELNPGFVMRNMTGEGTIEAYLHPKVNQFKIRSESRLGKYKTETKTFNRNALPDIRISMTPSQRPRPTAPETPPGLLSLESKKPIEWSTISRGNIVVIDAKTGKRVLGRSGKNNLFEEPFPLQQGTYFLYGSFKQTGTEQSLVFLKRVTIGSKHPGKRSVTLNQGASIKGSLSEANDQFKGINVGITPLSQSVLEKKKGGQSVYYPDSLNSPVDDEGSFRINGIPPGVKTTLHVVTNPKATLDVPTGSVLASKSITELQAGESRTLPEISISP